MTAVDTDRDGVVVLTEAEPATGWRSLQRAPVRSALPLLADVDRTGLSVPATCRLSRFARREPRAAATLKQLHRDVGVGPHRSPHPACLCGYRLVADRDSVERYFGADWRVLARVHGFGRAAWGNCDDPPGALRVEQFRVVELVARDRLTARALRQLYRLPVVVAS